MYIAVPERFKVASIEDLAEKPALEAEGYLKMGNFQNVALFLYEWNGWR